MRAPAATISPTARRALVEYTESKQASEVDKLLDEFRFAPPLDKRRPPVPARVTPVKAFGSDKPRPPDDPLLAALIFKLFPEPDQFAAVSKSLEERIRKAAPGRSPVLVLGLACALGYLDAHPYADGGYARPSRSWLPSFYYNRPEYKTSPLLSSAKQVEKAFARLGKILAGFEDKRAEAGKTRLEYEKALGSKPRSDADEQKIAALLAAENRIDPARVRVVLPEGATVEAAEQIVLFTRSSSGRYHFSKLEK